MSDFAIEVIPPRCNFNPFFHTVGISKGSWLKRDSEEINSNGPICGVVDGRRNSLLELAEVQTASAD